ncbi:peptidase inhibitor family I36 protein [Streptomyces platensis]|uniref:peptidase inhibitor family I36 protein n=1 Tax=Streptomyces platensis TaxID=58346 RepID=UPI002E260BD9
MKNDKSRAYGRTATGVLLSGLLLGGLTGQGFAADGSTAPTAADKAGSVQAEKTGAITLRAGNNTCYADHVCLSYSKRGGGANWVREGKAAVVNDFSKVKFEGVGPNVGKRLKDNVRSVLNGDQNRSYGVFEKTNYRGLRAWYSPNDYGSIPGFMHGKTRSGKFL